MSVPYRRKPIQIFLPIEAIEKTSAKEQSIGHGHPSTLDFWSASAPPSACRAVLFATPVDDPESDRSHGT